MKPSSATGSGRPASGCSSMPRSRARASPKQRLTFVADHPVTDAISAREWPATPNNNARC